MTGFGAGVVRELVTMVGFRVNTTQFYQAERAYRTLKSQAMGLQNIGRWAMLSLSLPIGLFARSMVKAASEMQLLNERMVVYTGSAEAARAKTKELQELALRSPMASMKDIGKTAGQLLARGVSAQELIPTSEILLNMQGALGGDIQRIAKAYTDVKARGTLQAQEVLQFVNSNIPIKQVMADYLGKSVVQVNEMMTKRLITFDMMSKAMAKFAGPGSQIATLIERIAKTPYGQFLKLKDQFFLFSAMLGGKLLPILGKLVGALSNFIGILNRLNPNFQRFVIILGGLFALIGPMIFFRNALLSLLGPMGIALAIAGALALIIDDIYVWVKGGDSVMGILFGGFEKYRPTFIEMKNSLVDLFTNLKAAFSDIRVGIKDFLVLLGALDTKSPGIFKAMLEGVNGLINAVTFLVASLRTVFDMMRIPYSKAGLNQYISDMKSDFAAMAGNNGGDASSPRGIGGASTGAALRQKLEGFFSGISSAMPGYSPAFGYVGGGISSVDAPINITINAPSGNAQDIANTVRPVVFQVFKEVTQGVRTNYVTKENYGKK